MTPNIRKHKEFPITTKMSIKDEKQKDNLICAFLERNLILPQMQMFDFHRREQAWKNRINEAKYVTIMSNYRKHETAKEL